MDNMKEFDNGPIVQIKLKQETPIIHFQYNEPGACLRASEVKPKLDNFLVDRLKRKNDQISNDWVLAQSSDNSKHIALNYKISFIVSSEPQYIRLGYYKDGEITNRDYEIYYGNMGREQVKAIQYDHIYMKIICFDKSLRMKILEAVQDFFIATNFGRMQDKGFGSFVVAMINDKNTADLSKCNIAESLKSTYSVKNIYSFSLVNDEIPFQKIKMIYSLMKSGVNLDVRGYERSLLFQYMHEKCKIGNEKAMLKKKGLAPVNVGKHRKEEAELLKEDHEHYYVRALLGVGDHIEFWNDIQDRRKADKNIISIKSKEIDRFESPILFKVIENNVYYLGRKIDENIFGAKFEFSSEHVVGKEKKGSVGESIFINVPTKEQLSTDKDYDFMTDFLEYVMRRMNNGVASKFANIKKVKIERL